jgi:predicted amidophosphoribosyltransferase
MSGMFELYAAWGQGCVACSTPVETRRPGLEGRLCLACRQQLPTGLAELSRLPPWIDEGWSAGGYSGLLGRLVRAAKYGGQESILAEVGTFLTEQAAAYDWPGTFDAIAPVPGTVTRRLARGFDPVMLLMRQLPDAIGATLDCALTRSGGSSQAGQSHAGRLANVRGAFTVRKKLSGRWLLVDDVLTTGATASACALALREAGAESVSLLVLASSAASVQVS